MDMNPTILVQTPEGTKVMPRYQNVESSHWAATPINAYRALMKKFRERPEIVTLEPEKVKEVMDQFPLADNCVVEFDHSPMDTLIFTKKSDLVFKDSYKDYNSSWEFGEFETEGMTVSVAMSYHKTSEGSYTSRVLDSKESVKIYKRSCAYLEELDAEGKDTCKGDCEYCYKLWSTAKHVDNGKI